MNKHIRTILLAAFILVGMAPISAQSGAEPTESYRSVSASNYQAYPDSGFAALTPPPAGKHPFYISHYGRHGSRYLSNFKVYDMPYQILLTADSLGKLTATGKEVCQAMKVIIEDSEGRWGDLSGIGKKQQYGIARRMMKNFPEVFKGKAFVDARSTIVTRSILSMGSVVLKLVTENPKLNVSMSSSYHDMWYMNHQDKTSRDSETSARAEEALIAFFEKRWRNPRLMALLFNDSDYVNQQVDEKWFNYYLLKSALIQQNTRMSLQKKQIIDYFSEEEIHRFVEVENAWWYINYGPSLLNGGKKPFSQRFLLRQMIQEADSIIGTNQHGASLRFGHETVIQPLICLLELDNLGYQTDDLEELETKGWWVRHVSMMASNVQIVFYRKNPRDKDVLFKVLLNEKEAKLPLQTDIAPYYHWRDFRDYYLKKLDAYELTAK